MLFAEFPPTLPTDRYGGFFLLRPVLPLHRQFLQSAYSHQRGADNKGQSYQYSSRFKLASHADFTYSGLPLMPRAPVSGSKTIPNFVAKTNLLRLPFNALPTSFSFVYGPYISAVSRKFMPNSNARSIVASDSFSSACAVGKAHSHTAEPISETSKSFPNVRFFIIHLLFFATNKHNSQNLRINR